MFFAHKSVHFGRAEKDSKKFQGSPDCISSSQENPVCLVCSETVGVTKELKRHDLSQHGNYNAYRLVTGMWE